jgi:hypothetical protein
MTSPASFWQRHRTLCLVVGLALLLALGLLAALLLLRGDGQEPMVYPVF